MADGCAAAKDLRGGTPGRPVCGAGADGARRRCAGRSSPGTRWTIRRRRCSCTSAWHRVGGVGGNAGMCERCRWARVRAMNGDADRCARPAAARHSARGDGGILRRSSTSPVIHDPSNDDQTWTRNWLRHTVLPELRTRNPDITQTLSRAAGLFAADAQFLEDETQRAFIRAGLRNDALISRHRLSGLRERTARSAHADGAIVVGAIQRYDSQSRHRY